MGGGGLVVKTVYTPLLPPWLVRAFKHWADSAALWQVQERKGFEPKETQNRGEGRCGAGELLQLKLWRKHCQP